MSRSTLLSDAIGEYQLHMEARGLEPRTIKNNLQPVRRGLTEWGNIQCGSITGQHIDRLFRKAQWGASTRNLYLGSLRGFFTWCRREGHIAKDFDPTSGWSAMRTPRRDRMRLDVGEFPGLLDACRHPRDRFVCALGLYTFLRGGEIASLRVADLDLSRFELTIWRHKTKEADILPVCQELAEEAERWLAWYRLDTNRIPLDPNWFLVPAKRPNRTRQNPLTHRIEVVPDELAPLRPERQMCHPYRAVQRALAILGYETAGEGEHTLRRSGARALFDTLREQGYDGALMRVSSFLGHKDTRITERYIGLSLERTKRNEQFGGKPMFARPEVADVIMLEGKG